MKKTLILEDHREAREMLCDVVKQALPEAEIDQAVTVRQASKYIKKQCYDLAIVDISLPDGNGIEFVTDIHACCTNTYIVMATIHDGSDYVFNALRAGAKGYLLKDQTETSLVSALKGILSGQPPLSPNIAHLILDYFYLEEEPQKNILTNREKEVLTLLAKGYNRKSIAELLGISHYTVADFIKQVYAKLEVHSSVEASMEAARMGLVNFER